MHGSPQPPFPSLPTMSTTRDTVISTPELLALILARLPMRDVLVSAPLVSKAWHAVILLPIVQRALFFQPEPASDDATPIPNPLLAELFPPFFTESGENRWSWPGHSKAIMSMPWAKAPDAFKCEDASWRRMLLSQPPANKILVVKVRHGQIGDSQQRAVTHGKDLRMGELYDLCASFQVEREADITVDLISTAQCMVTFKQYIETQFFSDGAKPVELEFGESVLKRRR
ncbi:hypothetical protein FB45DRAFT_927247 [Roridomyces roridus]|uniref:F-box domain-containing protein n=1 Tax=Roridomyces roridus TaxID=1738132 RepID=A0AAD7FG41_9AGAR|nr:hypothetical protein FB45DRAFT_927247 [Roridomyces roridus]